MNKPVAIRTVTATLAAETMRLVEELAAAREISVEQFAATAIAVFANDTAADDARLESLREQPGFKAFIQEGLDDLQAGRTYTQAEMDDWFGERISALRAKAAG